ncbi:hypothetical protein HY640_00935 [Candidatus Woesearchaeota archaeon]|nr:hypothetical protein [Candidatus Woesearchaeota archaeon]
MVHTVPITMPITYTVYKTGHSDRNEPVYLSFNPPFDAGIMKEYTIVASRLDVDEQQGLVAAIRKLGGQNIER